MQDKLADKIAAAVEAELQRIAGRASQSIPFEDMSARDRYHRGLAIQYEFSARTNADAQAHFRRATRLDPDVATAYARLSHAMVISAICFDPGEFRTCWTRRRIWCAPRPGLIPMARSCGLHWAGSIRRAANTTAGWPDLARLSISTLGWRRTIAGRAPAGLFR
ncbi:MAG: hypothetical protein KJN93_07995 [Alphaproteobacteria bacterium]|nr:hypothetical protein [Alphaproteobacteria bacterium]NNF23489.1 hypothetical protein [Paracoccaceae bacterium]